MCGLYNEFFLKSKTQCSTEDRRSYDSLWQSDKTVPNMYIYLKLSNVYNINIKGVDYFVANWLLVAFI